MINRLIMKKKILLTASIAIVIAAGLSGMNRAVSGIESGLVFNANVEALARGEAHSRAICYNQYNISKEIRCLICGSCEYTDGEGLTRGGYCRW